MAKLKVTFEEAQARLDNKFPDSGIKLLTFDGMDRGCELEHPEIGQCGFTRFTSVLAYSSTQDLLYAMKRKVVRARKAEREAELREGPQLMLHSRNEPLNEDDYVGLRFYKDIRFAAGSGAFEQDDYNGYYLPFGKSTLYRAGVKASKAVCFTVQGNSMCPAMPDGTTIGVDLDSKVVKDGQVYAFVQDDLLRVKVIQVMPGQQFRLYSYNSVEYPAEVVEMSEIDIVGKVFWWSVLV
ncbi:hypothetical protein CRG49_000665 [Neisseria sp. N95_16]|uniref:DUF723 domain-containing protein n=1 Tax=Neisseria brasiliensis TaxID=2666100 RepID=A0A7X2KYD5_9NEIS|nr:MULTISPECIES: S24 family peptidase [Neisseria]MRN38596.1 DUF723 domain-containing protein [Neisseria brasiliensis]PJO10763.1 hypothetical protein CRG49_000665 [Neisseria sp. N95_16]